jgi:hypothetical protein
MCLSLRHLRILEWLVKTRSVVIADAMQQTGTIDHAPICPREVVQRLCHCDDRLRDLHVGARWRRVVGWMIAD